MKERPILFSAPMVRAILAGQKTQTRRVVKPQPDSFMGENGIEFDMPGWHVCVGPAKFARDFCPYGQPGDRLWVREAWRMPLSYDKENAATISKKSLAAGYSSPWAPIQYEANLARVNWDLTTTLGRYRHARFMPRWASRITLEITETRAERLHQITEEDAIREGTREPSLVPIIGGAAVCERDVFGRLWIAINGRESWEANPWVWVVSFRRLEAKP